jgi:MFS family permease
LRGTDGRSDQTTEPQFCFAVAGTAGEPIRFASLCHRHALLAEARNQFRFINGLANDGIDAAGGDSSPIAGAVADQYSRRKIIIWCDVLCGIAVSALAVLMLLDYSTEIILTTLFVVAILVGIIKSFFMPAIGAAIPDIVPESTLAAANSMTQASVQISTFVGQGLGGYLFLILGAPILFLIDGLTYLFSALSETFIAIPQTLPEKSPSRAERIAAFKRDILEGFRYAWNNAGLRALFFAAAFLNFFIMPIILLLPFYVEDVLHATADWYGYILAAFGFGALLGYAMAGAIKAPGHRKSQIVVVALILMSIGLALLSIIRDAPLALFTMIVVGILNGLININIITILQITTPSEIRGRVFGLLTTLTAGLMPIAMGLGGVVADLTQQNIPLIYATCGSALVILSALTSLNGEFRNFLAFESETVEGE